MKLADVVVGMRFGIRVDGKSHIGTVLSILDDHHIEGKLDTPIGDKKTGYVSHVKVKVSRMLGLVHG